MISNWLKYKMSFIRRSESQEERGKVRKIRKVEENGLFSTLPLEVISYLSVFLNPYSLYSLEVFSLYEYIYIYIYIIYMHYIYTLFLYKKIMFVR